MSDFFGLGTAINAGANLAGQLVSTAVNKEIADKNLAHQIEVQNYQKALQQDIFRREDTAVQRRRADLEAAGINPVLAAGGAAQAGSVVALNTPQNQFRMENPFSAATGSMQSGLALMLQAKQTEAQIARSNAETKNIELQNEALAQQTPLRTESMRLANTILGKDADLKDAELFGRQIDNAVASATQADRIQSIALARQKLGGDLVTQTLEQALQKAQSVLIDQQVSESKQRIIESGQRISQSKAEVALITKQAITEGFRSLREKIQSEIDQNLASYEVTSAQKRDTILASQIEALGYDVKMRKLIFEGWKTLNMTPAQMELVKTIMGSVTSLTGNMMQAGR